MLWELFWLSIFYTFIYLKSLHKKIYNILVNVFSSCSSPSLSSVSVGNDEEEGPVQGPINKEPEDKLYPERKKLGIRRL